MADQLQHVEEPVLFFFLWHCVKPDQAGNLCIGPTVPSARRMTKNHVDPVMPFSSLHGVRLQFNRSGYTTQYK
ncbi:hypothetical protein [Photorhabdus luminescens]|uniref:hypothetical protein n=1 Tax=Photorhabdus luminescens TaxID=29488 RepID=UPI001047A4FA|nr:hypothetical protein [Photorhabdus luminescens]